MNNLISDLVIGSGLTRVKCYFTVNLTTSLGDIKINNWKLFIHDNGKYYISPPTTKHKNKSTGELICSKDVHIITDSLYRLILDNVVKKYERKLNVFKLVTVTNKELQNDDSIK